MRKTMLILMSCVLAGALAACGDSNKTKTDTSTDANNGTTNNQTENQDNKEASGEPVTIRMFQFKVEIAEALNRLKDEYEKTHPNVKLEIETVGGGADYGAALKAKFASGEEPDIFNNGGFNEMETWLTHLEDLSDQPWVSDALDVAKEPMTKDGKIYGMPMNIEGYGFVYNKDLFSQAGITTVPKTITELGDAAKKLKDAGITPFANGYQEWWILGIHNFNVGVANQDDPKGFVDALNAGTGKVAGNQVFDQWTNLLDLTLEYSNPNPLTTDYNTQVTLFASGKAAIMQQGNWTQVQIDGINPNLNLGLMPMPISDDAAKNDNLYVGVPNNWVINNNSKVKAEAKEFLNWLATSDIGKKYTVDEFKFIPAFKSIEVKDPAVLGDIANDVIAYSKDGKTKSWNWFRYPEGLTQELGASMQAYIAKKLDKASFFEAVDKSWSNLAKK